MVYVCFIWGGKSSGMGREGDTVHGVRLVFTYMSLLRTSQNLFVICSVKGYPKYVLRVMRLCGVRRRRPTIFLFFYNGES